MEKEDFPKTMVAVLLVIAIFITIIGTWTVYSTVNTQVKEPAQVNNQGTISLEILNDGEPTTHAADSQVKLEILSPEEQ